MIRQLNDANSEKKIMQEFLKLTDAEIVDLSNDKMNYNTYFNSDTANTGFIAHLKDLIPKRDSIVWAEKIQKQFFGPSGQHIEMRALITANMKNPSSYKHVETTHYIDGSKIVVTCSFRGKNAFDATVLNRARGTFDINGNVLDFKFL